MICTRSEARLENISIVFRAKHKTAPIGIADVKARLIAFFIRDWFVWSLTIVDELDTADPTSLVVHKPGANGSPFRRYLLCHLAMQEPTKEELLETKPATFNTDSLSFTGLRGDVGKHLDRARLEAAIAALSPAPRDAGSVELLVARGPAGERVLPQEVVLTVEGGMPGDRWAADEKKDPDAQLATTRADMARVIANGQPLELHGDNLFLHLDISPENLPPGSMLRLGEALLRVTPKAHNGCKKWVQRFGLDVMQLNMAPAYCAMRIRGIYLQVVEDGRVAVGDRIIVVSRPQSDVAPA